MRLRAILFALVVSVCFAQTTLTIEQLLSFVKSSVQLRHPDKQVADFLRKTKLSEQLDQRTIEQLIGEGAGPKTVEALQLLAAASNSLPKPAPKAAQPAASPIPPASREEQAQVLAEARENSLNYDKSLPDFLCTQVTRRYEDPSGLEYWSLVDTLTARLSYFEGKEDYKLVLVNSHPITNISYEQVGGTTTRGEFGTWLRKLFEPKAATDFRWERWATLRGRRNHVFAYRVAQRNSDFSINYQGNVVIAGYQGFLFVDRDTNRVTRMTIDAVDVPSDFPIRQLNTLLDYEYVDIAGNKYLLPLRAVARSRAGKNLTRNETEFRLYRKFAAEATVTFTPEPLPEEQTKEQPPK